MATVVFSGLKCTIDNIVTMHCMILNYLKSMWALLNEYLGFTPYVAFYFTMFSWQNVTG